MAEKTNIIKFVSHQQLVVIRCIPCQPGSKHIHDKMCSIITEFGGERSQHEELQNATVDASLDSLMTSQNDQQNITTNDCSIKGGDSSLGNQLPPSHVRLEGSLGVDVSSTSGDLKEQTVESGFPCDICGKVFSHVHRMNAHRYHHVKRWRNSGWKKKKTKTGQYWKSCPKDNTDVKSKDDFQCPETDIDHKPSTGTQPCSPFKHEALSTYMLELLGQDATK